MNLPKTAFLALTVAATAVVAPILAVDPLPLGGNNGRFGWGFTGNEGYARNRESPSLAAR